MEEIVIDEPCFDASLYSFHTDSSEMIKYYYKLKFPDTYSLSPGTVLELLKDEAVFSQLEDAVKSFINCTNGNNSMTCSPIENLEDSRATLPVYDQSWNSKATSFGRSKSFKLKKEVLPFQRFPSPKQLFAYDSVHSIHVPLRTYENDRRVRMKVKPYQARNRQRKTDGGGSGNTACSALAEVTEKMSGLVFDRVEKPLLMNLPDQRKNMLRAYGVQKDGVISSTNSF